VASLGGGCEEAREVDGSWESGPPLVTPSRGNTLMKVEIFLRLNLEEHWRNYHLEKKGGGEGGSGAGSL